MRKLLIIIIIAISIICVMIYILPTIHIMIENKNIDSDSIDTEDMTIDDEKDEPEDDYNWSSLWKIGQAPKHCYNISPPSTTVTLNTTVIYAPEDTFFFNTTYLANYSTAKADGVIDWILIENSSATELLPNHNYVVECNIECKWGFPDKVIE